MTKKTITIKTGIYRHFKGGLYEVIDNGLDSDKVEPTVIYRSLEDSADFPKGTVWTRTLKEFSEQVKINGKNVRRFSKVENQKIFTLRDVYFLLMFPFLVFIINYIFCFFVLDWYLLWSLDTPMHFLGGLSIAFSINYALNLLEKNNLLTIKNRLIRAIIIITFVMAVAVLWEFYEFVSDKIYGTRTQPSVFDTIKDLYMGMFGATLYGVFVIRKHNKYKTDCETDTNRCE